MSHLAICTPRPEQTKHKSAAQCNLAVTEKQRPGSQDRLSARGMRVMTFESNTFTELKYVHMFLNDSYQPVREISRKHIFREGSWWRNKEYNFKSTYLGQSWRLVKWISYTYLILQIFSALSLNLQLLKEITAQRRWSISNIPYRKRPTDT